MRLSFRRRAPGKPLVLWERRRLCADFSFEELEKNHRAEAEAVDEERTSPKSACASLRKVIPAAQTRGRGGLLNAAKAEGACENMSTSSLALPLNANPSLKVKGASCRSAGLPVSSKGAASLCSEEVAAPAAAQNRASAAASSSRASRCFAAAKRAKALEDSAREQRAARREVLAALRRELAQSQPPKAPSKAARPSQPNVVSLPRERPSSRVFLAGEKRKGEEGQSPSAAFPKPSEAKSAQRVPRRAAAILCQETLDAKRQSPPKSASEGATRFACLNGLRSEAAGYPKSLEIRKRRARSCGEVARRRRSAGVQTEGVCLAQRSRATQTFPLTCEMRSEAGAFVDGLSESTELSPSAGKSADAQLCSTG